MPSLVVATCQIPVESCPNIKKQAFDKAFAKDLKADWDKTGKGLVKTKKMEKESMFLKQPLPDHSHMTCTAHMDAIGFLLALLW